MTRPIYEPTTQRNIAAQGYGQRQLFRRPTRSTDDVYYMEAYKTTDTTTVTNVIKGLENFDFFVWNDVPQNDVFFDTSSGTSPISIESSGLYHLSLLVVWAQSFTGNRVCSIFWGSNGPFVDTLHSPVDPGGTLPSGYSFHTRLTEIFFVDASGGSVPISCDVVQTSGVNQTVESVYLKIYRIGSEGNRLSQNPSPPP